MAETVDPDRLEEAELPVVRRGLDPAAVRSTLAEAADGLRLLTRRCHELEHRIETLEAEVPEPEALEREREEAQAAGAAAGAARGEEAVAAARAEAETIVEDAKEEGRRLVHEAQTVRRRMLEDLGRRRRALRRQIEQLRGGRERLLEAYEVVGHTMREATEELAVALPEARAAAERAGHGVGPEETVEQLEAEIESARMAGLPIVTGQEGEESGDHPVEGARRRPVAVPVERDVRDMREVEPVVADFEEVRVLPGDRDAAAGPPGAPEAGPADGPPAEPSPSPDDGDDGDDGAASRSPDLPAAADDEPPGPAGVDGRADAAETADDRSDAGGGAGSDAPGPDGEEDVFDRLRRARQEPSPEPAGAGSGDGDDGEPAEPAAERSAAEPSEPAGAPTARDLDHPDDADEPFGLALGAESDPDSGDDPAAARPTIERDLARRLKRLLSDEQNDVLDRLRRTRRRTLTVDDLLDDFDERVARFAAAVAPVLRQAAATAAPDDPEPVDDLAAELAREVAQALVDGIVEPLEEDRPVDELTGPVRALYREWKTDQIGAVAERYVEAACTPAPPPE